MLKQGALKNITVLCFAGVLLASSHLRAASGFEAPLRMRLVEGKVQSIELLGGDKLTGEMKSFTPPERKEEDAIIHWVHKDTVGGIEFRASRVSRIQLNYQPPRNLPKAKICNIHLRNGDTLAGMVSALTSEVLRLQTWYAGEMTIPRGEILSISAGQQSTGAIYEGPTGITGWTGPNMKNLEGVKVQRKLVPNSGTAGWSYKKNAFYTGGSGAQVGRTVKYADQSSIAFDLEWRGYFQLHVNFYADKLEQYSGNAYSLRINQSSASLYRITNNGQSSMSSTSLQSIRGKARARFMILVNRKKNQVTLLVDGVMKQQWTDPAGFAGKGNFLLFASQGSGALKLSKIVVDNWDGRIPTPESGPGNREKHDILRLADNDRMTGKLIAMEDQKVIFVPTIIGEEYTVPLEKVARIDLAGAVAVRPGDPPKGYVHAYFTQGGMLTFRMKSWGLVEIQAESEILKNFIIRPDAFTRIDFNLDVDRPGGDDPFGF